MNFTRVVKVTTANANAEILQQEAVKASIKNCLGLDEQSYQARLAANPITKQLDGFNMKLDIVSDVDTSFSINGETQNLVGGCAYSSDFPVRIYSIKMQGAGTATFIMNIRS